jgi:hypothetical protein
MHLGWLSRTILIVDALLWAMLVGMFWVNFGTGHSAPLGPAFAVSLYWVTIGMTVVGAVLLAYDLSAPADRIRNAILVAVGCAVVVVAVWAQGFRYHNQARQECLEVANREQLINPTSAATTREACAKQ